MANAIELWCSICAEPFNDRDRVPILLQCAHTFCKLCLQTSHSGLKACPTCRAQVSGPITSMKPNFALIQALESAADASGSPSGLSPYFATNAVAWRDVLASMDLKVLHSVLRKLTEAGHDVSR